MPAADPPVSFVLGRAPFVGRTLNVAAEARDVLRQMAPDAARCLVQLEMAVPPELSVHTDRLALHTVLRDLIDHAMRHATGGRVLLSALAVGRRVQIEVIDDGAAPAQAMQEAALRETAQLVALQGGTIDIDASPGDGTSVVVRLPEPAGAGIAPGRAPSRPKAQQRAEPPSAESEAVAEASWEI